MSRKKSKYWGKPVNAASHPYVDYENTLVWRAVKKALVDLDENQDLELIEWHQYIVGYVCKQLAKKDICTPESLIKHTGRQTRK